MIVGAWLFCASLVLLHSFAAPVGELLRWWILERI